MVQVGAPINVPTSFSAPDPSKFTNIPDPGIYIPATGAFYHPSGQSAIPPGQSAIPQVNFGSAGSSSSKQPDIVITSILNLDKTVVANTISKVTYQERQRAGAGKAS